MLKKILKYIQIITIAAFLGVAKSFGYKTTYEDKSEEEKIEGEK